MLVAVDSKEWRRHGETPLKLPLAVKRARDTAMELISESKPDQQQRQARTVEVWKPPAPGTIKINMDGTFSLNDQNGSSGLVLRDDSGSFRRAMARWYPALSNALHAEALACRDGIKWAEDRHVDRVLVETDSFSCYSLELEREEPDGDRIYPFGNPRAKLVVLFF